MVNNEIIELRSALSDALQTIEKLTAQIAWFQRQLFGAKSEKFVPVPEGTALLPGFEATPEAVPSEPAQHIESHERKPREKFG